MYAGLGWTSKIVATGRLDDRCQPTMPTSATTRIPKPTTSAISVESDPLSTRTSANAPIGEVGEIVGRTVPRVGTADGVEVVAKDVDAAGPTVGASLRTIVGAGLGDNDGAVVGADVGDAVGPLVGTATGACVVGRFVGPAVGSALGATLGSGVGILVGAPVGVGVDLVGATVGAAAGACVGTVVGPSVGVSVGGVLGLVVGVSVGSSW